MALTQRERKSVRPASPGGNAPQTIEATSKHLKGLYALGVGMSMIGMLWALLGAMLGSMSWLIGAALFFSGVGLLVVTKIRMWWNHG